MDNAQEALEWLIGGLVTIISGVIVHIYAQLSALRGDMESAVDVAKHESQAGDVKIWEAHNKHVEGNRDWREAIVRELGSVAKKSDLDALGDKLMAEIRRSNGQNVAR